MVSHRVKDSHKEGHVYRQQHSGRWVQLTEMQGVPSGAATEWQTTCTVIRYGSEPAPERQGKPRVAAWKILERKVCVFLENERSVNVEGQGTDRE